MWLHRRAPQGFAGVGYITEAEILSYAYRVGLEPNELALAMDRCDQVFFAFQQENKPKG